MIQKLRSYRRPESFSLCSHLEEVFGCWCQFGDLQMQLWSNLGFWEWKFWPSLDQRSIKWSLLPVVHRSTTQMTRWVLVNRINCLLTSAATMDRNLFARSDSSSATNSNGSCCSWEHEKIRLFRLYYSQENNKYIILSFISFHISNQIKSWG
jgi:hypothetical protein